MKIKCIGTSSPYSSENVKVEIDRIYTVYGLTFIDKQACYVIYLKDEDEQPIAALADLFEIIDSRISKYWQLAHQATTSIHPGSTALIVSDLVAEENFYTKLLHGERHEIELFKKYKDLMNDE